MANQSTALFQPRCASCHKSADFGDLLRCSRCKIVQYCSQEHQKAHWTDHKDACNLVKKARARVDREETKLRTDPGMWTPNPFENSIGHFWGILETRPYMRARYGLVEAMLEIKTFEAAETAYDDMRDMLRLCRSDNMGIRDLMPTTLLRLGRDQDCYDFIKWYATTGNEGDYDWGNMSLGFLDVKDADAFEEPGFLCESFMCSLAHISAVLLLKMKLLLDVTDLQNSSLLVGAKMPQELVDNTQHFLQRTNIIRGNQTIIGSKDHTGLISKLEAQVHTVMKGVERQNKFYLPALLAAELHLGQKPEYFSRGNVEEMQISLNYTYDAWKETPGALEMLKTWQAKG
ncbi:hypothetical protein K402DRAFT_150694 [Aulographum hederae CBS 113979]|uniref:MYND-type domain-containing protein n=1 Tax=Aulographum hederae CBS 113979 TaxID=1176131 RepID=A0A6G1GTK1_9PEZI|nr:hypothetical protein K402DRAFT_150694 [Aulographum hederae CBS 113979]